MTSIKILGTGSYAPPHIVTNDDFQNIVETNDEWIRSRTGMVERHISQAEPTWYLGALAAQEAIKNAEVPLEEIGLILVTSVTPDFVSPAMACIIQHYLGIADAMALDINIACTGLAFSIDMAYRYLATGAIKYALLISAEELSQITNYEDRTTCVLFGDGAGAVVVGAGEGAYGTHQGCNIDGTHTIHSARHRKTHPFNDKTDTSEYDLFPIQTYDTLYMNGREVYKFATKILPSALEKACEQAGISVSDLDLIIPHQANLRIIETAAKNLDIPLERFYVNIEKYGNTSSASIPIALHEAITTGRLKRGNKVGLVGFGAGLTYGATVFEY